MSTLLQKNDQIILTPITKDGSSFPLNSISAATYKLFSRDKKVVKIVKTLGSGIEIISDVLTTTLSYSDTASLKGTYYHELQVVDSVEGVSTVFGKEITFGPTYN